MLLVAACRLIMGVASLVMVHRLRGERALGVVVPRIQGTGSVCGARAQLLHSTWGLPGSGIEPMSPALAGGLFNY